MGHTPRSTCEWGCVSPFFCWVALLGLLFLWVVLPCPFAWCWRGVAFLPLLLGGAALSLSSALGGVAYSPSFFFLGVPRTREGILTKSQTGRSTRSQEKEKQPKDQEGSRKPGNSKTKEEGKPNPRSNSSPPPLTHPRPSRKGHSDQLTPTLWCGAALLLSCLVRAAVLDIFTFEILTAKFFQIKKKRRMFLSKVTGDFFRKTGAKWEK